MNIAKICAWCWHLKPSHIRLHGGQWRWLSSVFSKLFLQLRLWFGKSALGGVGRTAVILSAVVISSVASTRAVANTSSASQAVAPLPTAELLLIEPVTVLTPSAAGQILRQANQQVLIQGDRIVRVAAAGAALPASLDSAAQDSAAQDSAAQSKLRRFDGRNYYLTPGLMDSHVHLAVGTPPGVPNSESSRFYPAFEQQQPRSYLYFGVTQVVDLNGDPAGITRFSEQLAPDVFRCGAAPVKHGYGNPAGGHPDYVEATLAAKTEHGHGTEPTTDATALEHSPLAVVARIKASGAHCLKLYIENGFGDAENLPVYSDAVLQQLVGAARQAGLPVFAHANALDMQQIALRHQVDVLAHGLWNWAGLSREQRVALDDKTALPAAVRAHLQQIYQQQLGYQPTLGVLRHLATVLAGDDAAALQLLQQAQPSDLPSRVLLSKVVDADLLQWYQSSAATWFRQELLADFAGLSVADAVQQLLRVSAQGVNALRYLHQLGQPLVLSSDTPSAPLHSQQPGLASYQEMLAMAEAGIPAADIFVAATLNNARLMRIEHDYGSVSAGKIANLLLLKQDPSLDVRGWNSLETVILRGALLPRSALQARLSATK